MLESAIEIILIFAIGALIAIGFAGSVTLPI